MKKLLYHICVFSLLLFLAGCSGQQAPATDIAPVDIASAILQSQQELPVLMQMTSEDAEFATWMSDYCFLQAEWVSDGVICYGDGVEVSEIVVLLMADEGDCRMAKEALKEYIQNRAGIFEGYAPLQAAMIKEGTIAINGKYIAMLICPDPRKAEEAFSECFDVSAEYSETDAGNENNQVSDTENAVVGSEKPEGTVGTENSYHAEAVLQAYRSGDDSSLSEIDRSILEAASNVVASEIRNDMSDYEKELAIHDYITDWSRFDYSVFGRSSEDGISDGSDTPYGVLINRSAMCHGYSSTFQLFMDMLDIECITVFGVPGSNGVEHSWNMVKLDGEWYCVDCAWDDPIGGSPGHTYFNVTSEYLRRGSIHRWDESSVPEAVGTFYAYGSH